MEPRRWNNTCKPKPSGLQPADNLAELHLDYQTISAGLLHDVVEDCDVSNEDLTDEFGEDIAKLVFGVTKLTEVENVSEIRWEENTQTHSLAEAQTLRKMLMTVAEDVRVVLIKLSDRLHNMETVDPLPGERKIKFAKETMEIYAPLAHRLGMWDFKWRLEDLSFRILDPNMYKKVAKLINSKRKNRDTYIEKAANIDPTNKENLDALKSVSEAGIKTANEFSWDNSAKKMMEIINNEKPFNE